MHTRTFPKKVLACTKAFQQRLSVLGWPTRSDRNARTLIIDQYWRFAPVGLPSDLRDEESVDLIEFFLHYDIVRFVNSVAEAGSWESATCTCAQNCSVGICGHILAIFLRMGGNLALDDRESDQVVGYPLLTGTRRRATVRGQFRGRGSGQRGHGRNLSNQTFPPIDRYFPYLNARQPPHRSSSIQLDHVANQLALEMTSFPDWDEVSFGGNESVDIENASSDGASEVDSTESNLGAHASTADTEIPVDADVSSERMSERRESVSPIVQVGSAPSTDVDRSLIRNTESDRNGVSAQVLFTASEVGGLRRSQRSSARKQVNYANFG